MRSKIGMLIVALSMLMAGVGCKPDDPASHPPAAPAMPSGWVVKQDVELERNKIAETEYRLEGKIRAQRATIYEVGGKKIQLNVIVALDTSEADKMYRILANLKQPFSYGRKGDTLYEFVAGVDALDEVKKGKEALKL